jgi:hypothetical protein
MIGVLPANDGADGGENDGNSGNFGIGNAGVGMERERLGTFAPGISTLGRDGNSGIETVGNAGIGIGKSGMGIFVETSHKILSPIFAATVITNFDILNTARHP